MKRVAVLGVQVPFVRGGAEMLADSLVAAINRHVPGARAELIQLPFRWYPDTAVLDAMMAWRLIDVTEADGHKIDLVIPMKFPSYLAESDRKVVWLVHQHRPFYDLADTPYDLPRQDHSAPLRRKVRQLDTITLQSALGCYAMSQTVADRLSRYNGIATEIVYPPSPHVERIVEGPYGDRILYVGRVEIIKRPGLLVEALAFAPRVRVRIVGSGKQVDELRRRAAQLGVADRCEITGFVSDEALVRYLAEARAVFYGPIDEDYGFAGPEAFQAGKPLITLTDAGEVRRFVEATGAGWICEPTAEALGQTLEAAYAEPPERLRQLGDAGKAFARRITWENVVSNIVTPYL
jgi:glycosyltransferase involved in cell wall biosynthesis